MMIHDFANPVRFQRLTNGLYPWCFAAMVLCLGIGLPWSLLFSPADYQQGESVRIMYFHVPSAWMALFTYLVVAACSAASLIWRHAVADIVAQAASPIGACFTALALATGALWGKPMWGAWWVWDARLTSVLVLFFLYLGHIALARAFDDAQRGARAAALLAVVGVVNLPIIKFSVDWWSTLHQPASIMKLSGPSIHSAMLWPLLLMILGFMFYFLTVLILRSQAGLLARRQRVLRLRQLGL